MPDYPKMYATVVSAASDALDKLPEIPENAEARALLQQALFTAEEMYIAAADGPSAPGAV